MDLDLLLLGKTGIGKSATGNAILGRKAFKSRGEFTSVTVESRRDVAELATGRKLYVVDTPGVADTGCSKALGKKMFHKAITEAIAMSPQGYHALLLALRYGSRLTEEDINVLSYLKELFGEDFIKNYCILTITHGDNFKTDDDIDDASFLDWCQRQMGHFKWLYREVGGRVILFDNRGGANVKAAQRQELVDMVDKMMENGSRYTNEKFEEARKERERVLREMRQSILNEEINTETSLILARLANIKDFQSVDEKLDALKVLKVRSTYQLSLLVSEEPSPLLKEMEKIIKDAHTKIEQEAKYLNAHKEQTKLSLAVRDKTSTKDHQSLSDEEKALSKNLQQKLTAGDQTALSRIQELEKTIQEYESDTENKRKDIERLTDEYQKLRDQSNSNLVTRIWNVLSASVRVTFSFV